MKKTLALVLAIVAAFSMICSTAFAKVTVVWNQVPIVPSLWEGFEVNINKAEAKNVIKDGKIGADEYDELVVDNEKMVIVNQNYPTGDPEFTWDFKSVGLDLRKTMRVFVSWDDTNGFNIAIQYHVPANEAKCTNETGDEAFLFSKLGGALIQIRDNVDCIEDPELEKFNLFNANIIYHAIGYNTTSNTRLDCLYQGGYLTLEGNPLTADKIPAIFSYDESTETVTVEASYPLNQITNEKHPNTIFLSPQVARGQALKGNMSKSPAIEIACFGETGFYVKQEAIVSQHAITGNISNNKVGTPAAKPVTDLEVKADKANVTKGTEVTWTATATDGIAPQYSFALYKGTSLVTSTEYGQANTFKYKLADAGSYRVKVYAKDGSTTFGAYSDYVVAGDAVTAVTATADKATAAANQKITWTAKATGGANPAYAFYLYNGNTLVSKTGYGTSNTFSYTPTTSGEYRVRVYAKEGSTSVYSTSEATVVGNALSAITVNANKTTAAVNTAITWTITPTNGVNPRYAFYLYKDGKIVEKKAYDTATTYTYTPTAAGEYKVVAYAKDGAASFKQACNVTITAK